MMVEDFTFIIINADGIRAHFWDTFEITKLDKEKNKCIMEKKGSTGRSKGNKTVPEKVATTRTEDGHK
jgi:hypothetical protein